MKAFSHRFNGFDIFILLIVLVTIISFTIKGEYAYASLSAFVGWFYVMLALDE